MTHQFDELQREVTNVTYIGQADLARLIDMVKLGAGEDYFRRRLRDERKARGWSQADVANMLSERGIDGVYHSTVARIEAGERAVRLDELIVVADILDIPIDALLGRGVSLEDDVARVLAAWRQTARSGSDAVAALVREVRDRVDDLAAVRAGMGTTALGVDDAQRLIDNSARVMDRLGDVMLALSDIVLFEPAKSAAKTAELDAGAVHQ